MFLTDKQWAIIMDDFDQSQPLGSNGEAKKFLHLEK